MGSGRHFHHAQLPNESALLAGRMPSNDIAFRSDSLQVWFNETKAGWEDNRPHFHTSSDEMFVVLDGTVVVEVDGRRVTVRASSAAFPLVSRIASSRPNRHSGRS